MLKHYTPGTQVCTAAHEKLGTISRLVIDPQTDEVTHLVVRKGLLFKVDKVVPVSSIKEASENAVVLQREVTTLDTLPDFEKVHYVDVNDPEIAKADFDDRKEVYWYPPLLSHGALTLSPDFYSVPLAQVEIRERNTPPGTVALKQGAHVISKEGEFLGKVNSIYFHPENQQIVFFLISQGGFLKKEKVVPAWWVSLTTDDEVHLVVTSSVIERLPSFEPQH